MTSGGDVRDRHSETSALDAPGGSMQKEQTGVRGGVMLVRGECMSVAERGDVAYVAKRVHNWLPIHWRNTQTSTRSNGVSDRQLISHCI